MNIIIRPCTESDIDDVISLQEQWVEEDITYGHVPSERDQLLACLGPYFLVAEHAHNVIGFVLGTERVSDGLATIRKDERYLEIVDLFVDREQRGQGTGSLLVQALETEAQANGIGRFLLYSANKDIHSIMKFYHTHGFKSWSVQMFK